MMKSLIVSLLMLLAGSTAATAQHTVESIRKLYGEVQESIRHMMNDEMPAEYYNLHVKQNLPGTGPHDVNIYMYYDEKPGQEEDVIYPEHYLQFATTKYNFAARQYYEEYLYDAKGQLMFAYSRYISEDIDNVYELRLWFDGKRMLRALAKENTSDDWEHPVIKDVYTGINLPEKFQEKSESLKDGAQQILDTFNGINKFPF